MGVNDRDYMKKDGGDSDVLDVNLLVKRLVKTGVFLVVFLLCLRFPILWIKIPLSLAAMYFGTRWIFKPAKKVVRKKGRTQKRPDVSQRPGTSRLESGNAKAGETEDTNVVRQLISLDAAGKFGQAKSLIQELDGREFPRSEGEELAVVAGNYFPVQLEPSENGVRFMLM